MPNWNDIFSYQEGYLYWKISPTASVRIGDRAGRKSTVGYWFVVYGNKQYQAHRVIWEMHNEALNSSEILDHINRNKQDNRLDNLRLVTISQNIRNQGKRKNNTSGYIGVCKRKNNDKWMVCIRRFDRSVYLGDFNCPMIAAYVYDKYARKTDPVYSSYNFVVKDLTVTAGISDA